jgi:hypothetical protein
LKFEISFIKSRARSVPFLTHQSADVTTLADGDHQKPGGEGGGQDGYEICSLEGQRSRWARNPKAEIRNPKEIREQSNTREAHSWAWPKSEKPLAQVEAIWGI